MNVLWSYFWPVLAIGLLAGVIAGSLAFRSANPVKGLAIGAVAAIVGAAIWHGPLGAADRFQTQVNLSARDTLDFYEMKPVRGVLRENPLSREILLSGPADDFQRSELVRILQTLPGVRKASWSGGGGLPLIAEASLAVLAAFVAGAMLAYLIELRRRYNSQWKW